MEHRMSTRSRLFWLVTASAVGLCTPALAQNTIKIGELNSYKAQPAFLEPYKKGWELAVEEINAKGGVLGRKLEVISRDDGASPGDAVRVANELVTREGTNIIAGAVVQAIDDAKPDAIFNVLFGGDLAKLVREGTTRGTFKNRTVVSLLSGEPEYLDPLKDEAPVGWIVTGYPWDAINTPAHKAFVAAYQKRWNDYPRLGSVVGYDTINSLAAGIAKAGSTDTDKLVAAFRGLKVEGPLGPFEFRANDHQATMGAYVGKIALKDGKGTMSDFKYVDGASVLPSDEEVKKLRPAAAMN